MLLIRFTTSVYSIYTYKTMYISAHYKGGMVRGMLRIKPTRNAHYLIRNMKRVLS